MEFISKELQQYAERHTSPESKVLKELDRETNLKANMPRMISGHFQGRVLSMISNLVQPTNILEIGTYTGYSAICLAEGLREGGKLITIDINEELSEMVHGFVEKAGLNEVIECKIGKALEVIPTLKDTFDLIFIDADKGNYSNYYNLCIDKLNKGGLMLIDNVLWSGKVLEDKPDPSTIGILEVNNRVQYDDRVENVLLPIRDGLMAIRKK